MDRRNKIKMEENIKIDNKKIDGIKELICSCGNTNFEVAIFNLGKKTGIFFIVLIAAVNL